MRIFTIIIFFALCFQGCIKSNRESKTNYNLNYKIKNDQFYIDEQLVPSNCFGQLITELNGDNIQGTIFLTRNSFRGCIDANFKTSLEKKYTYVINKQLPENKYKLTVFEKIDGSLRVNENRIIIQFINKPYILANGKIKMILSLDKIGEW